MSLRSTVGVAPCIVVLTLQLIACVDLDDTSELVSVEEAIIFSPGETWNFPSTFEQDPVYAVGARYAASAVFIQVMGSNGLSLRRAGGLRGWHDPGDDYLPVTAHRAWAVCSRRLVSGPDPATLSWVAASRGANAQSEVINHHLVQELLS